jgi:hypothetical protein
LFREMEILRDGEFLGTFLYMDTLGEWMTIALLHVEVDSWN